MPVDKSLFYYGRIYHQLFDGALAEARQVAVDLVAEDSSVLDIACGTGQLCFALSAEKHCRVIGVDLSLRMLGFAEKLNCCSDVTFMHQDATELVGIEETVRCANAIEEGEASVLVTEMEDTKLLAKGSSAA